jgi:serine/threonine protein phosphatase PrpC
LQIIKSIAVSEIGKVREHNEDALYSNDAQGLWTVADGMGGHASGEIASKLAIDTVTKQVNSGDDIAQAIMQAHQAILNQANDNPDQKGMGTTLVSVLKQKAGFNIAWVGDSRAYYYDGKLQQLTSDHTFVQDMVYREVLTPEEADTHHKRNLINRSLGMGKGRFKVDSFLFKPKRSGFLLICSDGVSDYIDRKSLEKIFEQSAVINNISESISSAVMASIAGDNFSYILVEFTVGFMRQWRNRFSF